MKKLYVNECYAIFGYSYLGKVFGKLCATRSCTSSDKIGSFIILSNETFEVYKFIEN